MALGSSAEGSAPEGSDAAVEYCREIEVDAELVFGSGTTENLDRSRFIDKIRDRSPDWQLKGKEKKRNWKE